MSTPRGVLIATEPYVRETAYGKWLATSPVGTYPRIGLLGNTETAARERWHDERVEWVRLLALPDPPISWDEFAAADPASPTNQENQQ